MFNKKNQSNILFFAAVCVIGLIFYFEKTSEEYSIKFDKELDQNNISKDRDGNKRYEVAGNAEKSTRDIASNPTLFPTDETTDESKDMNLVIDKNDPILKVLEKFEMAGENQHLTYEVDYDHWFVSKNYVIVPNGFSIEGLGERIENTGFDLNFQIVKLFEDQISKNLDFPPLVISHSTNTPVSISGDLMIKYNNLDDVKDFLSSLSYFESISSDQDMAQVKRVLLKLKNKSEVMRIYRELNNSKGSNGIDAVEFDIRHQFKVI